MWRVPTGKTCRNIASALIPGPRTRQYLFMTLHNLMVCGAYSKGVFVNFTFYCHCIWISLEMSELLTELWKGVETGDVELVKKLLDSGADPNTSYRPINGASISVLVAAVIREDILMVKLLLTAGADVNQTGTLEDQKVTPLMAAIYFKRNMDLIKLLAEHGCDVNKLAFNDQYEVSTLHLSALHLAIHKGQLDVVKYLTEELNANVFVVSGSVIYATLKNDNVESLCYILEHAVSLCGDRIWWNGPLLNAAMIEKAEKCAAVLLLNGLHSVPCNNWSPDVFPFAETCNTVFHDAACSGCWKAMKLLKHMYPYSLQENWFVEGAFEQDLLQQDDIRSLMDERKQPPRLDILCRAMIFQQLGYRQLPTAGKLPLPRKLKEYVQFKDILGSLWPSGTYQLPSDH